MRQHRQRLMSATVAQNATAYSSKLDFTRATGEVSIYVTSTAGSVTVTQQCSHDGSTWSDPVNASNSAVGAVAATMTVGTRYVYVTPVLAPWIRYKVVENNTAETTVTIDIVMQEES